jgi:hypothetical protein
MRQNNIINETKELQAFYDITAPELGVEIQISPDKKVLWVHVDGQTVLRICRIPLLKVT